jgi:DNA replication protein DnaC
MLILPTEKSRPATTNPKTLILFGKPKAGKSTLMAALDNNLIIDLENGYQALSAMVVQARSVQDFADIANAIREKIKENDGKFPYKYITIDNATRLEEMCLPYACQL